LVPPGWFVELPANGADGIHGPLSFFPESAGEEELSEFTPGGLLIRWGGIWAASRTGSRPITTAASTPGKKVRHTSR
jgi:hypothetical protein